MRKKNLRIFSQLDPDADLEALYLEAVREWEEISDPLEAENHYRVKVFPLACERIRRRTSALPPTRIAFIPVGTQEYSPILAALANPSEKTILLHTKGSLPFAKSAQRALKNRPGALSLLDIGDGTDGVRLARAILAEHSAVGLPPGEEVAVDLTGGRKSSTATLGAVATIKGFRQSYIEAQASQVHKGFFHSERLVYLANVKALVKEPERNLAMGFMLRGAFKAAMETWQSIAAESGASARDEALARISEAFQAWSAGRWAKAAQGFSSASKSPLMAPTAPFLQELTRLARGLSRGKGPLSKKYAFLVLAGKALEEGNEILAQAYLSKARIPTKRRTRSGMQKLLEESSPKGRPGHFQDWREAADPGKAAFRILAALFGEEIPDFRFTAHSGTAEEEVL